MNWQLLLILIETLLLLMIAIWGIKFRKKLLDSRQLNSTTYSTYLQSPEWQQLRISALERANYRCELCQANYHGVHHIRYPKHYSQDELANLLVVCQTCHQKLHGIRENTVELPVTVLSNETLKLSSVNYQFQWLQNPSNRYLLIIRSNKLGKAELQINHSDLVKFTEIIRLSLSLINQPFKPFTQTLKTNRAEYLFEIKKANNNSSYLKIIQNHPPLIENMAMVIFADQSVAVLNHFNRIVQTL